MDRPNIVPRVRQQLVDLGISPEDADELLVWAQAEGERIRREREARERHHSVCTEQKWPCPVNCQNWALHVAHLEAASS